MQELTLDSSYLEPGEYVVWQGKPEKGRLIDPNALVTVPFGIIWTVFSLIFLGAAYTGEASILVWLIVLLFLFIGLSFTFGGFIRHARVQGKIHYYVTNYRLILTEGENISFYMPDDLPPMNIRRYKNGNASILFARRYVGSQGRTYAPVCVLENIKDVAGAQRALSAILREEPR